MNDLFINTVPTGQLSSELDQLFCDFDYLGILKNYGSCGLFINSLVCRALNKKNYTAAPLTCYAELELERQIFLLGHPDYIDPGQLAGHVFCLVEGQYLVDFGLGNLRKFDPDFTQAIACSVSKDSAAIAALRISPEKNLTWIGGHSIPNLATEIQAQETKVIQTLALLERFRHDRLGHCLRQARTTNPSRSAPKKSTPLTINWPLKNFDDTLRP